MFTVTAHTGIARTYKTRDGAKRGFVTALYREFNEKTNRDARGLTSEQRDTLAACWTDIEIAVDRIYDRDLCNAYVAACGIVTDCKVEGFCEEPAKAFPRTIFEAREIVALHAEKDGETVFAGQVRAGSWDIRNDVQAALRGELDAPDRPADTVVFMVAAYKGLENGRASWEVEDIQIVAVRNAYGAFRRLLKSHKLAQRDDVELWVSRSLSSKKIRKLSLYTMRARSTNYYGAKMQLVAWNRTQAFRALAKAKTEGGHPHMVNKVEFAAHATRHIHSARATRLAMGDSFGFAAIDRLAK